MRVLVTGATGYIGGRLIPRLLEAGHTVRVLVRDTDPIRGRPWERDVEVVRGDLLKPLTLGPAVTGVDAAYYLVHSMYGGDGFAARDRRAAGNFVAACDAARQGGGAGPMHVVYLGGLMPEQEKVHSDHLKSRAETGRVLADGMPGRVTEFRAGPIIGSGSASFEMVRYLTERLPVMVTPRWIYTRVQPIAVRDVLSYLSAALDAGPQGVVDIGGEVLTFKQMMLGVAEARGLWRLIVATPFLAPRLAARWVGLVTPIPNALAVPLVAGVTQDLVADPARSRALFPDIEPIAYDEAVRLALSKIRSGAVETRWSDAPVDADVERVIEDREGLARDQRNTSTDVPAEYVFRAVCSIGGTRGYYTFGWAWWLRGVFDRMIGGPGLRRGRRHPTDLREGDALDFWRVEQVRAPRAGDPDALPGLLRLRAEMKLPGLAWLQWEVEPRGGKTLLRQSALFEPRGLPGTLYWYLLLPAHGQIFPRMLRALEGEARKLWGIDQEREIKIHRDKTRREQRRLPEAGGPEDGS